MDEKKETRSSNYDRYLLLDIKKAALLLAAWLLSVLLHNAVYALTGHYSSHAFEEPFFFIPGGCGHTTVCPVFSHLHHNPQVIDQSAF